MCVNIKLILLFVKILKVWVIIILIVYIILVLILRKDFLVLGIFKIFINCGKMFWKDFVLLIYDIKYWIIYDIVC